MEIIRNFNTCKPLILFGNHFNLSCAPRIKIFHMLGQGGPRLQASGATVLFLYCSRAKLVLKIGKQLNVTQKLLLYSTNTFDHFLSLINLSISTFIVVVDSRKQASNVSSPNLFLV